MFYLYTEITRSLSSLHSCSVVITLFKFKLLTVGDVESLFPSTFEIIDQNWLKLV